MKNRKIKSIIIAVVIVCIIIVVAILVKIGNNTKEESPILSEIRELSLEYKNRVAEWSDFSKYDILEEFEGEIYITVYHVDEKFNLAVGSEGKDGRITFVYLKVKENQNFVDIRFGNLGEFIEVNNI